MGFGVGDLFSILAGGAWLAKDAVCESLERDRNNRQYRLCKTYVDKHTDPELEKKLKKDIEDPKKYNQIWERIEKYQRDNPLCPWNRCYEDAPRESYVWFFADFKQSDIGKKRLPVRNEKGSLYGRNSAEGDWLFRNQEFTLSLLMWTYGKESSRNAINNACNVVYASPEKYIEFLKQRREHEEE